MGHITKYDTKELLNELRMQGKAERSVAKDAVLALMLEQAVKATDAKYTGLSPKERTEKIAQYFIDLMDDLVDFRYPNGVTRGHDNYAMTHWVGYQLNFNYRKEK